MTDIHTPPNGQGLSEDTDEAKRCVVPRCGREIPAWDRPRVACDGCQQRTAQRLGELPDLYVALNITPARSGSAMVGTRHAVGGSTVPINLTVVDLTSTASHDSVLVLLDTWARDWADRDDIELPTRWGEDGGTPVEHLCRWLRHHLDWACRDHPAVDDFVREIGRCYRRVRAEATGERPPRIIPRACPCGGSVPFRLGEDRFRCDTCHAEYGWAEATHLDEAPRSLAA